jgi:hypothetical protein
MVRRFLLAGTVLLAVIVACSAQEDVAVASEAAEGVVAAADACNGIECPGSVFPCTLRNGKLSSIWALRSMLLYSSM